MVTSDKLLQEVYRDEVIPITERVLARYGLRLTGYSIVPNIREAIAEAVFRELKICDAVLVTGGTGLGPKDVSVEAVRSMCSKDIPGFGELFRYLTYQQHGAAALATRAMACAVGDKIIFVTPGSPSAVELALDKLIAPELRHLLAELRGIRR